MCNILVYDWQDKGPYNKWRCLLDEAERFDGETGQPGCEDPNKVELMKEVLDRLKKLEERE